jgi:hypothetical protein
MTDRVASAVSVAPVSAAGIARTRMGMIMTIITTTTRKRGAIG